MTDQPKEIAERPPLPRGTVMRPVGTLTSYNRPSHTRLAIDLSPEAIGVLNEIRQQTGDDLTDVFRKALALYKVAVDAHDQGKVIGAAASADQLETEFIGF